MDTATYAAITAVIRPAAKKACPRSREEAKFSPWNLSVLWPVLNAVTAGSVRDAGSPR